MELDKTGQVSANPHDLGLGPWGTHWVYRFDNGYGASVIDSPIPTGGAPYELAVLRWLSDMKFKLDYDTPITSDVLRGDCAEINQVLKSIAALEAPSPDLGVSMRAVEVKACSDCPFYQDWSDSGGWIRCAHPSYVYSGNATPGARNTHQRLEVEYNEPPPSHCPGAMPVVIKVKR